MEESLHAQAERHHEERRNWRKDDRDRYELHDAMHRSRLAMLVVAAMLRPLIELAILVVLIVKL